MSLLTASQRAAKRLKVFQRIALNASEIGERVDLSPAELWEPEDQAVLCRECAKKYRCVIETIEEGWA